MSYGSAVLRDLITEAKKMTPEEYEMLLKESYDMEEVKIVFPKRATIWMTSMRQWMSPVCAPRDSVRRAAIVTTLKTISVGELVRQDLDALGTTREDIFHHYSVVSSHQTLWFVSLEDIFIGRKQ